MKTRKYFIILTLILLTNIGFGQDSISQSKNPNKSKVLNGKVRGLDLNDNKKDFNKIDTVYVIKNTYKLNQVEINSILDSISKTEKINQLVNNYKSSKEIFNDKNLIFLYSLFNLKSISYKFKRTLLRDKIDYDENNKVQIISEYGFRDFPNSSYQTRFNSETIKITKKIYSKKRAINHFINSFDDKNINFYQALFVINGNVKKNSLSSKNYKKLKVKKLKINKLKINKLILLNQSAGTPLFGDNGKYGVIVITTEK